MLIRRYLSNITSKSKDVHKYLDRQLNDEYAKLAREHNYRARSAFKLLEMNENLKLFRKGQVVLDIGAAPGSWSQVAAEHVQPDGERGYILGVDLQMIQPVAGVQFIQRADICDPAVQEAIIKLLNGRPVDCVLSDMAPNPTGSSEMDRIRLVQLCSSVLSILTADPEDRSKILIAPDATFLFKLWDCDLRREISADIERLFGKMSHWYKQYIKAVARWPIDRQKSSKRNFKPFLENYVEKLCHTEPSLTPKKDLSPSDVYPQERRHAANIAALNDLLENRYSKQWPHDHYKSASFGLYLQQVQEATSEKGRAKLGFGRTRFSALKEFFLRR